MYSGLSVVSILSVVLAGYSCDMPHMRYLYVLYIDWLHDASNGDGLWHSWMKMSGYYCNDLMLKVPMRLNKKVRYVLFFNINDLGPVFPQQINLPLI